MGQGNCQVGFLTYMAALGFPLLCGRGTALAQKRLQIILPSPHTPSAEGNLGAELWPLQAQAEGAGLRNPFKDTPAPLPRWALPAKTGQCSYSWSPLALAQVLELILYC